MRLAMHPHWTAASLWLNCNVCFTKCRVFFTVFALKAPLFVLWSLVAAACTEADGVGGGAQEGQDEASEERTAQAAGVLAAPAGQGRPEEIQERPAEGTERDWQVAREQLSWAQKARLDTLPRFGDALARVGERFIDTPYEPHTLELSGPERLVINLETLDCVTFVENMLVLARLAWSRTPETLDDLDRFKDAYRRELTDVRYRGGVLDGYPIRLHYFSEWIADNEAMGLVDGISDELGGVADPTPIDFMSTHPDAYRQLAEPGVLAAITSMEARLRPATRHYIPTADIPAREHLIQDGDIIAATSTVPGLDIAHTGIAVWRGGVLRLLHAPLVGSHVQLSDDSLAERIRRIDGQDGIMVARPLAPVDPAPAR